uniref:Post-GPI attachment to proteins factor 2 n=1 Tax=Globodera rostochiensis TaxID=31243 RepID=A0A914HMI5_GLORO
MPKNLFKCEGMFGKCDQTFVKMDEQNASDWRKGNSDKTLLPPKGNAIVVPMVPIERQQSPPGAPTAHFRLRTLCLIGALLPGVGCYVCLFYTFLFQSDRIRNFTSSHCPNVLSRFPPVSYSIGVWQPQKSFWLFVLFLHMPARLFFGFMYKSQFALGLSEYKNRSWYDKMVTAHVRLILLEMFGLVAVSIIDIDAQFVLHALAYFVWIASFNFNMLFNTILHHHSGIRKLRKSLEPLFYLKCAICYGVAYPLSVSTGFTYFGYLFTCNSLFYSLFSLAEYIIVGVNSLFYFMMIWEMEGSELELK